MPPRIIKVHAENLMERCGQFTQSSPEEVQPTPGNLITPLVNGEAAYPQMLAAIESACCSISLATYFFANDGSGDNFCKALTEAVERGVMVRVLIDGRAILCRPPVLFKLKKSGIMVRHLIRSAYDTDSFLSRYHRRILVVDGHLGFSGGMTIRDAQLVNSNHPKANQDVHFRMEGPVVSVLQGVFAKDWRAATGELLDGRNWFPSLKPEGNALVKPLVTGQGYESGPLESFLCRAISSAHQKIDIVTPYFVPTDAVRSSLASALKRRVSVRLIIPRYNFAVVEWASCRHLEWLLKAGCVILAAPPPFDHSKIMTIDDNWSLIGSANWDPLSFFVNAELVFEVHDTSLREQLGSIIDNKAEKSLPVSTSSLAAISRTGQLVGRLIELYL